ncbi:MAG: glycoside hydrolase family 20 zincin-like fold domain-containing protein [Bacteroidales bacterium]
MKKLILALISFGWVSAFSQVSKIIPASLQVNAQKALFVFPGDPVSIMADKALYFEADYLSGILKEEYGIASEIGSFKKGEKQIQLFMDQQVKNVGDYILDVSGKTITIRGSPKAFFTGYSPFANGCGTILKPAKKTVAGVSIIDSPDIPTVPICSIRLDIFCLSMI